MYIYIYIHIHIHIYIYIYIYISIKEKLTYGAIVTPSLVCRPTVYSKKYAHGFCFAVLCCGYTLTDFPISIRLTSLALWQSNDCPSASKATLMNMDKYFLWIHYERLHNHNKAKHNKTVCIFLGIYCTCELQWTGWPLVHVVVYSLLCARPLPWQVRKIYLNCRLKQGDRSISCVQLTITKTEMFSF